MILQTVLLIFSDLCGLGSAKRFGADPSFGGVFARDIPIVTGARSEPCEILFFLTFAPLRLCGR
jgi:hypothetical protein